MFVDFLHVHFHSGADTDNSFLCICTRIVTSIASTARLAAADCQKTLVNDIYFVKHSVDCLETSSFTCPEHIRRNECSICCTGLHNTIELHASFQGSKKQSSVGNLGGDRNISGFFKYMICRLDEKIKQTVKVTRASAMKKLDIVRKKQVRVDNYVDYSFRFKKVNEDERDFYDKGAILQVFDQNQFNLVVIELLILAMVIVLGIFKDYPAFQFPAAASFMIFLTIMVMLSGAFSYWFGNWSITVAMIIFLFLNYLAGEGWLTKKYKAFGLDYDKPKVAYTIGALQELTSIASIRQSQEHTLGILENWKKKFEGAPAPKMVFICTSGGGMRAAVWAMQCLQKADSATAGNLMKNAVLMSAPSRPSSQASPPCLQ